MRKQYRPAFKAQIVLDILKEEKTLAQLAAEHGIHPNQLRQWKNQALEGLPAVFADDHKATRTLEAAQERERTELYAEIGRLTTQLAWLKKKSGIEPV